MVKAKTDFLWYKSGQEIKPEDYGSVHVWIANGLVEGEITKPEPIKEAIPEPIKEFDSSDLNKDGKVDKADVSIAGKTLKSVGSKLKGRR